MHIAADGSFVRTDAWREGKYLDLWSVPHLLSGIVVGLALSLFGFSVRDAVIIAFLLLVMYEMWEVMVQITETRWNRTLDVVVGMSSCVPTLLLAPQFTRTELFVALAVVGVGDAVLSFIGWHASQKASVLEAKLRAEFELRRREVSGRARAARARWQERRLRRRLLKQQKGQV